MNFQLNESNRIIINPNQGCQIHYLALGGRTIINLIENTKFTSSGSYLMYPWVNRIIKSPYEQTVKHEFSDEKGYPLHGLFANTKRKVKVEEKLHQEFKRIDIKIQNTVKHNTIHGFQEVFTLGENWFEIQFNALETQHDPNPYCFGYHPYFELSKPVSELKIESNLDKMIVLEEDLLMRWPKELKEWTGKIDGKEKYDSLFQGAEPYAEDKLGNFIELDDGLNKLRIESNLEYWQIYTPPGGKKIAIQPMSFHGNIYEICKQNPQIKDKLPKSGRIRVTIK